MTDHTINSDAQSQGLLFIDILCVCKAVAEAKRQPFSRAQVYKIVNIYPLGQFKILLLQLSGLRHLGRKAEAEV